MLNCATCTTQECLSDLSKAKKKCPSLKPENEKISQEYKTEKNYEFARAACILSQDYTKTRIEETIEFAKMLECKKVGLAFCIAVTDETKIINRSFRKHGLKTETVMCKVGSLSKDLVNVEDLNNSPFCNPIAQAEFFNEAKTDLNVVIGLCVGHDALFSKYSEAPVTTLAVKDRVLANNPLGACYMANTFYKDKLFPTKK
jgi:uncharacterized metal-binding protein